MTFSVGIHLAIPAALFVTPRVLEVLSSAGEPPTQVEVQPTPTHGGTRRVGGTRVPVRGVARCSPVRDLTRPVGAADAAGHGAGAAPYDETAVGRPCSEFPEAAAARNRRMPS